MSDIFDVKQRETDQWSDEENENFLNFRKTLKGLVSGKSKRRKLVDAFELLSVAQKDYLKSGKLGVYPFTNAKNESDKQFVGMKFIKGISSEPFNMKISIKGANEMMDILYNNFNSDSEMRQKFSIGGPYDINLFSEHFSQEHYKKVTRLTAVAVKILVYTDFTDQAYTLLAHQKLYRHPKTRLNISKPEEKFQLTFLEWASFGFLYQEGDRLEILRNYVSEPLVLVLIRSRTFPFNSLKYLLESDRFVDQVAKTLENYDVEKDRNPGRANGIREICKLAYSLWMYGLDNLEKGFAGSKVYEEVEKFLNKVKEKNQHAYEVIMHVTMRTTPTYLTEKRKEDRNSREINMLNIMVHKKSENAACNNKVQEKEGPGAKRARLKSIFASVSWD